VLFPYKAIVFILSLVLCVIAVIEAKDRWRYAFIGALLGFFLTPLLFPLLFSADILFYGRIVLGIICYLYLRWIGYPIK